jgi:hypothetical protein
VRVHQDAEEQTDMAGPGPLQEISPDEQRLVERAIGAAVIDRLRGSSTSLIDAYRSVGGSDLVSIAALQAVDGSYRSWDLSQAERTAAGAVGGGSFAQAYGSSGIDRAEQTLVERTIGLAYLLRLQGQPAPYPEVYASLGGGNARTRSVFEGLEPLWGRVDVAPTAAVLETV